MTRSSVVRPLSENFCFSTVTESDGVGKIAASDEDDTNPSLLPVGTDHLGPFVCNGNNINNFITQNTDENVM